MVEPKRACERCEWFSPAPFQPQPVRYGSCGWTPLWPRWAVEDFKSNVVQSTTSHAVLSDDWCAQFKERAAPPVKEE